MEGMGQGTHRHRGLAVRLGPTPRVQLTRSTSRSKAAIRISKYTEYITINEPQADGGVFLDVCRGGKRDRAVWAAYSRGNGSRGQPFCIRHTDRMFCFGARIF